MNIAAAAILIFIVTAAFILQSNTEKGRLSTEYCKVGTPSERTGRRLVFLTDLHGHSFGEGNRQLTDCIKQLAPDLILIGGDMIVCRTEGAALPETGTAYELIRELVKLAPVVYGEGNHEAKFRRQFPGEFDCFRKEVEACGALWLTDGKHCPDRKSGIAVSGVSLEYDYYKRRKPFSGIRHPMPPGYLEGKLGKADLEKFNILLIHSPMYLQEAAEWGADLVLSGHYHGGTVRIPGIGGLMTPQFTFFVRECAGRFEKNGTVMLVSRGLGTHSINIRINNLPEITCIDLEKCGDANETDQAEHRQHQCGRR